MTGRQSFMLAIALSTLLSSACNTTSTSTPSTSNSASLPPFSLNVASSANQPLTLQNGGSTSVYFAASSAYVFDTWSISVDEGPSPLCALAVPTTPVGTSFVYQISTASQAVMTPAGCISTLVFSAAPASVASASPQPIWTATLYVRIVPTASPTPSPAPSPTSTATASSS